MQHSPVYSPVVHHTDASRPSLGFPLGTALLLIIIFSLSGIFSCCYHWDKFRSLRQSYADDLDLEAANHQHPHKPKPNYLVNFHLLQLINYLFTTSTLLISKAVIMLIISSFFCPYFIALFYNCYYRSVFLQDFNVFINFSKSILT